MHDVRYDLRMGRLLLSAGGFWCDVELAEFMGKVRSAVTALASVGRPVSILAVLRTMVPQSQAVFGAPGFLETAAMIQIDRHAVVTASALIRIQFRRFFAGIPTEFFEDVDAAIAWLGWSFSDPLLVKTPSEDRVSLAAGPDATA